MYFPQQSQQLSQYYLLNCLPLFCGVYSEHKRERLKLWERQVLGAGDWSGTRGGISLEQEGQLLPLHWEKVRVSLRVEVLKVCREGSRVLPISRDIPWHRRGPLTSEITQILPPNPSLKLNIQWKPHKVSSPEPWELIFSNSSEILAAPLPLPIALHVYQAPGSSIPSASHMTNRTRVYTTSGYVCCLYNSQSMSTLDP